MHKVFALLWLYLDWFSHIHQAYFTGTVATLTIAPVPAKQPWWIWINTSCEFIMNDCITTTKQSTIVVCLWWKTTPGPVFCLLLGVSSDYAQPITGQVTVVTCPVIGRAQPELTPSKRQKSGPGWSSWCISNQVTQSSTLPHVWPTHEKSEQVAVRVGATEQSNEWIN